MTNIYATFDVFPSAKGASTHINQMLRELSTHAENTRLLCLRGHRNLPAVQQYENILIKRYYSEEKLNYLKKATLFSEEIFLEIEKLKSDIKIAHFRDVWSGLGIVAHKEIPSVFEVNALTSIELPYRYPNLTSSFLSKLKSLEQQCLDGATAIVTPSFTTQKFLTSEYNISEDKITVIQNGAEIPETFTKPDDTPENYLIYFGAIQSWQGLDTLLKAFSYLVDYTDLKLMICLSVKEKVFKSFLKLAKKLNIDDRIILKSRLKKQELYNYIHFAKLSIAPLKACDRNVVQGCSPLKILESMACKTTVVASQLPVVTEIVDQTQAMLFEPDRELDLARCIRIMLDEPEQRQQLADNAFNKLKNELTWQQQLQKLHNLYNQLQPANA